MSNTIKLNTFAHALIAFIIYVQWWHKPLDVEESSFIRGDLGREMLAWMSMYEPMDRLGICRDHRMEARRIRTIDRDDPYARVNRGRFNYRNPLRNPENVV